MWKVKRLDDKYTGQFENLFYELELHLEGTIPVDKEVSNKVARGTDITLLRILSIFTGILYTCDIDLFTKTQINQVYWFLYLELLRVGWY